MGAKMPYTFMGKYRFIPMPKPSPFFRFDMGSLPIERPDSATYANTLFVRDADAKASIIHLSKYVPTR